MTTIMDGWQNAPGPGDLDPGPAWCMGGACPHDHGGYPWDDAHPHYGEDEHPWDDEDGDA